MEKNPILNEEQLDIVEGGVAESDAPRIIVFPDSDSALKPGNWIAE